MVGRQPRPRAGARRLGWFLCWSVVFADLGTSVYYTPGILYGQVGTRAALFVGMTMVVFVLLTDKYREVAVRYPEGGGVVTVAGHAIGPVAGLVGGLLILVDYFLTSALSATSGVIYLGVVFAALKPVLVPASIAAIVLLGLLNMAGVRSSASVSAVFAVAAAAFQLLVVIAVIVKVGPAHLGETFPRVLAGPPLTPLAILTGYAGAFLAFSGLESIAQLAPAIAEPRQKVARAAMIAVVATTVTTSPLLTLWSTTLLDARHADPNQFISLLGGYAAGQLFASAVAVSASLLLVFACNTALIGSYYVFIALSKMHFLPRLLTERNRVRGTPHYAILLATAVPLLVVLVTRADTGRLGDLYAFGLLGAFTMTCIGLDIVRWQERHEARAPSHRPALRAGRVRLLLGVLTTILVALGWFTNFFAKPLATLFGGTLTLLGLGVAWLTRRLARRRGRPAVYAYLHRPWNPFVMVRRGRRLPDVAVAAVLPADPREASRVVAKAAAAADGGDVLFVYSATAGHDREPGFLEILHPYLEDQAAQDALAAAEAEGSRRKLRARYIYIPHDSEAGVLDWVLKNANAKRVLGPS
jgi:amino acid transporter